MTTLHSATSPELEKLRSLGQAAKIRAIFVRPPAVFKARVNQVFTAWDSLSQVAFDGVTLGAYTSILSNMEIWIGTTEGACDVGTLRARKSASSSSLYFNESSDVKIMDNQHITAVLDFLPRARHIWVDKDGVAFVDRDVAYTDQHRYWLPVPVLGCHAVAKLTGPSVSVPFDGSGAWCIGDGIWKHDWYTLNGGSIVGSGGTNLQATFTATAPGTYWVRDRVTTWTYTRTNDGYRLVHVWDAAHPPSRVRVDGEFLSGSNQEGGFVAKLTILDDMDTDIPDRALCILFTEDYFNARAGTLGQIPGRENILFTGWVRGETITESQLEGGLLDLEVAGLHWWLQNQESFPHGIEYISTRNQPADWVEMQDLDAHKVTWSISCTGQHLPR